MLQQDAGLALRVVHLQCEHVRLRVAEDHRFLKSILNGFSVVDSLCWHRCVMKGLSFQQVKLPMRALLDKICGRRLRHSCCRLINLTVCWESRKSTLLCSTVYCWDRSHKHRRRPAERRSFREKIRCGVFRDRNATRSWIRSKRASFGYPPDQPL